MEIILVLAILGVGVWWFFIRDEKKSDESAQSAPNNVSAPYKVPEPAETTPIPLVVNVIPVGTEASIAVPTKAKAPAKPKATTAKAPAKPKAPAKAKAPIKPKAPKTQA